MGKEGVRHTVQSSFDNIRRLGYKRCVGEESYERRLPASNCSASHIIARLPVTGNPPAVRNLVALRRAPSILTV